MLKATMKTTIIAVAAITMGTAAQAEHDPFNGKFNNYQCYKVKKWDGKIVNANVKVKDQFGAYGQYAARPVLLCNPVSINGKKIPNPRVHLVCYSTDPNNDGDLKEQSVAVHNIFGDHKLALERVSQLLCVTSTKRHL